MHDKIVSFIERHRIFTIFILVIVLIFGILCCIRWYNKSTGHFGQDDSVVVVSEDAIDAEVEEVYKEEPTEVPTQAPSYSSSLSIKAREKKAEEERARARLDEYERRKAKEEEDKRVAEARKNMEPTYGDAVLCWSSDGVPDKMVDGSSCKEYLSRVSLSDFGSKWGSKLTMNDKLTTSFYMVGVDQNPKDRVNAIDCQSLGYLISNINKWGKNTAIKFTDLNTIGSLSNSHVAILCSYDWYSVYGMQDTLVVFEDISGTLKPSDFKQGTIFSAMVYRHNIRIKNVAGQVVVCVQYNTFKK